MCVCVVVHRLEPARITLWTKIKYRLEVAPSLTDCVFLRFLAFEVQNTRAGGDRRGKLAASWILLVPYYYWWLDRLRMARLLASDHYRDHCLVPLLSQIIEEIGEVSW